MRTDPDLAAEAMAGNEAAFAELVRRHQGTVRGLTRRLMGASGEGDDIAQAAFLQAWRKIGTYQGGAFKAWLCKIAYREVLQARRRRVDPPVEAIAFATSAPPVSALPIDHMDLDRALRALPEAQRHFVILCVAAGLSHREAAEMTNTPLGTVKSHVRRGVAALRTQLMSDRVA